MITHKGKTHPGPHKAIVEPSLFEAVQEKLDANARRRESNDRVANAPLASRIFDIDGQPMSPTFSYGKQGKLYRYYVSAPLQQGNRSTSDDDAVRRISAPAFEAILEQVLRRLNPVEDINCIERVEVHADAVHLLAPVRLLPVMRSRTEDGERVDQDPVDPKRLRLILPVRVISRSGRVTIIPAAGDLGPRPDKALIRALRAAHTLVEWNAAGMPTLTIAPASSHKRSLVHLAFLAPDLQRAILEGRQPPGLTVKRLMQGPLPARWADQIQLFGAPQALHT